MPVEPPVTRTRLPLRSSSMDILVSPRIWGAMKSGEHRSAKSRELELGLDVVNEHPRDLVRLFLDRRMTGVGHHHGGDAVAVLLPQRMGVAARRDGVIGR